MQGMRGFEATYRRVEGSKPNIPRAGLFLRIAFEMIEKDKRKEHRRLRFGGAGRAFCQLSSANAEAGGSNLDIPRWYAGRRWRSKRSVKKD